MGSRSFYEAGLSTLEVMSALIILGLVVSIGIANYQPVIDRFQLNETKLELEGLIQDARLENVRSGKSVDLKLLLENRFTNIVVEPADLKIVGYGACPNGIITRTIGNKTYSYKLSKLTCVLSENVS